MKSILNSLLFCLALLVAQAAVAQDLDVADLEDTIQKVVEKVRPATVAVRMGDGDASGVIVSKEGHVLTAGHCVMEPGMEFEIELPDGRVFEAVGMGLEPNLDCGLIKIEEEGDWPFVELGWSSELKKNQPCISLGHSHGFKAQRGPVVRFGRIVDPISKVNGYIQSSCLMEPGDSGGPLFDLKGRLIGIHSQCGEVLDENFEVPVDAFRRYWNQLNEPEKFHVHRTTAGPDFGLTLPSGGGNFGFGSSPTSVRIRRVKKDGWADTQGLKKSDRFKKIGGERVSNALQVRMMLYRAFLTKQDEVEVEISRDGKTQSLTLDLTSVESTESNPYASYTHDSESLISPISELEKFVDQFSDLENQLDDHCAKIAYERNGRTRYAQGTVLSFDDNIFVLCKKSMVGDSPKVVADSDELKSQVVLQDEQNDVVLLKLDANNSTLTPIELPEAEPNITLGEFLISPNRRNSGQVSVRGAPRFSAKSVGFFGVVATLQDDLVILGEVVDGSAAEKAGFVEGDEILEIAGKKISSPNELGETLRQYSAGDEVEIKAKREDEELVKTVTLGSRSNNDMEMQMHAADFFAGGKSKVREGFSSVIAHDARVQARDCGGPVFDTDGNLVGVNIARFSRTQCYILPTQEIKNLVEKACKEKSDDAK